MIIPITPFSDKKKIIDRIITDPYILHLGFTKAKTYSTNTTVEKIAEGNMQIFVYNAPSRTNENNSATLEQIIQVDVSVPIANSTRADLGIEQIIALLNGYEWENHSIMNVIAPSPVPLACQSGFYCVAARFSYFTTNANEIKTVVN